MTDDSMQNFMLYQGVKDKIAGTITALGLDKCKDCDEVSENTFEEIKMISKAYGLAVGTGQANDIVRENSDSYTTLHFLMDMVIVQTLRASAAKYGINTELQLNIDEKDDDEAD